MRRIDGDGNVDGMFVEGNPTTGQVATQVTAQWLNDVQEEIINVRELAGPDVVFNPNNPNHMRLAIASFVNRHPAAAAAWGVVERTFGGAPVLLEGHGVASVEAGAGVEAIVLNFDLARESANYAALITVESATHSGSGLVMGRLDRPTSGAGAAAFEFVSVATGNVIPLANLSSVRFSFVVYGSPAV